MLTAKSEGSVEPRPSYITSPPYKPTPPYNKLIGNKIVENMYTHLLQLSYTSTVSSSMKMKSSMESGSSIKSNGCFSESAVSGIRSAWSIPNPLPSPLPLPLPLLEPEPS